MKNGTSICRPNCRETKCINFTIKPVWLFQHSKYFICLFLYNKLPTVILQLDWTGNFSTECYCNRIVNKFLAKWGLTSPRQLGSMKLCHFYTTFSVINTSRRKLLIYQCLRCYIWLAKIYMHVLARAFCANYKKLITVSNKEIQQNTYGII